MSYESLIRNSNRVARWATVALIYWVFVFLIITVFDLKIFREHMTETFLMSVLGIFALLGGALVLNVMSNLSRISDVLAARTAATAPEAAAPQARSRRWWWVVVLSFPVIALALFGGNHLSERHKRDLLIRAANKLVAENQPYMTLLSNYQFSLEHIVKASNALDVMAKIDKNFPEVMQVVPDAIDGKKVWLGLTRWNKLNGNQELDKLRYIVPGTQAEREYLEAVFSGRTTEHRFRAEKGNYELYFPVAVAGKTVVLYLSDQQRYGKIGS